MKPFLSLLATSLFVLTMFQAKRPVLLSPLNMIRSTIAGL